MSERSFDSQPPTQARREDPTGFDALRELALDMRWSWNHATDTIWRQLDPELWALTHNPWVVLLTVSRDRIQRLLSEPDFRKNVDALVQLRREAAGSGAWFQQAHPRSPLGCVAYFSMEFMLSEALPIYSGGLGNVAGDQLKTASDLGVPVVGVGLLYQQGYFRQVLGKDGAQEALFPYNDPGQLPITPLRCPDGEWLRVELSFPGGSLWLRAWQVQVGRVKLYLLDSNDAANVPVHRSIASELYGGGPELRLEQELLLGLGGWKLLRALGIRPEVCHLNEGHAAFAVLERARCFMEETGQPFETALTVTRTGNLFTTHTAVAAGFDCFAPALVAQYLRGYAETELHTTLDQLLALGRQNQDDPSEPFNMAYLATRGSGAVNAVSHLHGKVSRHIFGTLFPRWPEDEVPIGHVTNGVHAPSWDSETADRLWTSACGKGRWAGATERLEAPIRDIPDAALWRFRQEAKGPVVEYIRDRLARQLATAGASTEAVEQARQIFDPKALTLGFARRFATYKRPNLLLSDPERLLRLLTNRERPVQLVLAGKAHPADAGGQALIQAWARFINRTEVRPHVVFLSDYDMLLTEHLVQGVDVWINTPRRPWEACGTSGMKVLVNGGLNLSELDGWWAEAYTPEVGWALGDGQEHGDDPSWDAAEAEALYDLLEQRVIPEFYARDAADIPVAWVAKIRASMALLTAQYSATRAVREYTEAHYLPAAAAYRERAADQGVVGSQLAKWRRALEAKWAGLRFLDLKVERAGDRNTFEVQVDLGGLDPQAVRAELYADGLENGPPVRQEMTRVGQSEASAAKYRAQVSALRPATDYTPRLIPYHPRMAIPLEVAHILWRE